MSQVRVEIYDYYRKQHRPPGVSKMIPVLHHTAGVSRKCDLSEQLRREDTAVFQLFIKIFFNDEQVSQTKNRYVLNPSSESSLLANSS